MFCQDLLAGRADLDALHDILIYKCPGGYLTMLVTTEPSISGKSYRVLGIVFGMGAADKESRWPFAIERSLKDLEGKAAALRADAVIGVHLSTSETGVYFHAAVMGTAI